MTPELAKKYAAPVPRYASYPTTPHFSPHVDHDAYATWLSALRDDEPLSLYVHIPFCDSLRWYCGCTTKAIRRYDPVATYVKPLLAEIENVGRRRNQEVSHVHWGGGSPNILEPAHILSLADALHVRFEIAQRAEFAVEIDPRRLDAERISAFVQAGVTRVSLGVQDFDEHVQEAINRHQSFSDTKKAADLIRDAGVRSINIDLVYDLPHQTCDSVAKTINQVLALDPDRTAGV